jgi:hypothetical protein
MTPEKADKLQELIERITQSVVSEFGSVVEEVPTSAEWRIILVLKQQVTRSTTDWEVKDYHGKYWIELREKLSGVSTTVSLDPYMIEHDGDWRGYILDRIRIGAARIGESLVLGDG